jgi:hypothetical protein
MSSQFDSVALSRWLRSAVTIDTVRPEVAVIVHLEPVPKYLVSGTPARSGKFESKIALSWRLVVDATTRHA